MLLDMAMDVLVPPLSYLFLALAGGTAMAALLAVAGVPGAALGAIPWTVAFGMVILYVLRGVMLSNTGLRGLLDLAYAPVYIVWKVALSASGSEKKQKDAEWVRTTREDEEP
jgi:hypothetical protein